MRRRWKVAMASIAASCVALAVFSIPTLFGRPWSVEHFYLRVFAELLLDRPMLLSRLRILEPYGLDFHSDELDDRSVAFRRSELERARRELEILRSYDRETLTESERLSNDVLDSFLATIAEGEPFLLHEYPVNQLEGVQTELPDFLVNVHQIHSERDARDFLARLTAFPVVFEQVTETLRLQEAARIVPPRFVLEKSRAQIAELVSPRADENVLHRAFATKLEGVEGIDEAQRDALLARSREILERQVVPAYHRLDGVLADLLEKATSDDGAWKLPDGDRYYAWTLRSFTTTNLSADEIHRIGLAEVARIEASMRAILDAEGHATNDLAAALAAVHRDPRELESDDDAGRERILAGYRRILDEIRGDLPRLFGRLPRAEVVVERVPPFKEAGAPGAYYYPPPLDRSKPGVFYANLRSVAEIPRFGMRTLAYHEAIPGHHLQIAIAQELDGLPVFRRVVPFIAYIEGWALYAERLAAEQGHLPDPLDRLGQLVAEGFRAVRLVVDTGIHSKRWTRERAIEYMKTHTGMPERDVVAEVERYIVRPGQACAYKIGQLRILELRDRAREALAASFDLREFHDTVLGNGALPLDVLEQVVDRWIARRAAESGTAPLAGRNP